MTDPHSLEAEVAVLGAALQSATAADLAVDLLTANDFYQSAHAVVFDAIRSLHPDLVDTTTVTDWLAARGRLDEVGGAVALYDLTDAVPTPAAAEHYCRIVAARADERRAVAAAGAFIGKVRAGQVEDLAGELETLAASATSRTSTELDPADIAADFRRLLRGGELVEAWLSGWKSLDRLFRLPAGLLTVVTGLPSSGKSTWLDVLLWRILSNDPDLKVAYFSPEQGPPAKHLASLVHTSLGVDPLTASPGLTDRIEEHRAWWQQRVEWIDDSRDNTPSAVLAAARAKVRRGVRVLVVDPYNNLMPDARSSSDRQDLYIADLLRRFKRFGRETGCAIVIVAHPRQMQVQAHTEAVFHVPTAGHIAGGNEWWNHADAIVCVWRNQSGEDAHRFGHPEDVKVFVQKVRDSGHWGRQGVAALRFDAAERRYREQRMLEAV